MTGMRPLPMYSSIDEVRAAAMVCQACPRSETRTQVVFGVGNAEASIVLIGEGPSATDDRTGSPYDGPAGAALNELLFDAGIERENVWITNLVRCFAGREVRGRIENRTPTGREITACSVWRNLELTFVDPGAIVTIGTTSTRVMTGRTEPLSELRGQVIESSSGVPVIPTFQSAYLMRMERYDPGLYPVLRQQIVNDLLLAQEVANS